MEKDVIFECGLEKLGYSRRPHKPEIVGSNPAPATKRGIKNPHQYFLIMCAPKKYWLGSGTEFSETNGSCDRQQIKRATAIAIDHVTDGRSKKDFKGLKNSPRGESRAVTPKSFGGEFYFYINGF